MKDFLEIVECNKIYFKYPPYLTTLLINSETPIYYIDELENLQTIHISGEDEYYQKAKINYKSINMYKQLKTLIITDNSNIEELDISNLQELNELILINNRNLSIIKGIENLKELETIIIVGNKIKTINNFRQFMENTKTAKIIKLDINMYHYMNKSDIIEAENENVGFAEKISFGQFYNLSLDMMQELYEKGLEITKKINTTNKYRIALEIYKYLVQNIEYDYEKLQKRNNYILEGKNIETFINDYKEINSSYNALINNKAVCEGYANAFKFLTNLKGIEAENIECFLKKTNVPFEYYNHTASRFKINEEWLYCDSQIEQQNEIKYFGLSAQQFEESHQIPHEITKKIGVQK